MALSNVESEPDAVGLEKEEGRGEALTETFGWISHKDSETTLFRQKYVSFVPHIFQTYI